ncbi:MAG: DJ-1/PfpI family protein [Planctomycetota bacterium]|jgi:putative intracellular protease/amidase
MHAVLVGSWLAVAGVAAAAPPAPAAPPAALNVGFLTLEGVYNSELMAPWDIFHHTVFHTKPGMRVFTVGRERGTVVTFEDLRLDVEYDLEGAPAIDVLVVPSAVHNMDTDLDDARLLAWIAERGRAAQHVLSVCDGAFLLAAAGLLDGLRCTTFPGDIPAFRERFEHLTVVEGVSFVADGKAITGAGGALSYDPALFLVERLYGAEVARGVARGMALRWDREKVRHLALDVAGRETGAPRCYLPGDRVDAEVTVEDALGRVVPLAEVVARHPETQAVVLAILGGAEALPVADRCGFWCEDSFSEIPRIRHLRLEYADLGVLFVAVLCPPIHHEEHFGYDGGSFVERPESHRVYKRNRRRFVEQCETLVRTNDLPFDEVLYDPRYRLLGAPSETGPAWQGRFKWFEDEQIYGTPTFWVLTPDLEIPGPPFCRNVYEGSGRKLRFSPDDVAAILDRILSK